VKPLGEAESLLEDTGRMTVRGVSAFLDGLAFVGEQLLSLPHITARSRPRLDALSKLWFSLGPEALPLVVLVSLLVGIVTAFVAAIQLQKFGASIYVANLVGIGTFREMGAMMTAIVMSGRSGTRFAAELGSMKAEQEMDALRVMGIDPVAYLMIPRIVLLVLAMPILTAYADLAGISGGALVAGAVLDVDLAQYVAQMVRVVDFGDVVVGLTKSTAFGAIIGLVGCYAGSRAEPNAESIGQAATQAAVWSIVGIIAADGLFAYLTHVLGV
jgi:phospholipid/cholesterol/gamma-HCH transport system permease protein